MSNHVNRTSETSSNRSRDERKLRILVVEDEGLIAMLIEDMVLDLGHEVAAVSSRLEEALHIAQTGSFDLAILDVNLNGKPSYPIADVLVSRNIPFAFATGYGRQEYETRYKDVPTLPKPFVGPDFARIICELAQGSTEQR
jgi:CheY-like chemotaxis protein